MTVTVDEAVDNTETDCEDADDLCWTMETAESVLNKVCQTQAEVDAITATFYEDSACETELNI